MITQFLVNPKIFLYLVQNPDEQNLFMDKVTEYWMKYALQKHMLPKNDESWEFKDKSIVTLTFDDVKKLISVSYQPTNPIYFTGSQK